jgi:hypothetical protein
MMRTLSAAIIPYGRGLAGIRVCEWERRSAGCGHHRAAGNRAPLAPLALEDHLGSTIALASDDRPSVRTRAALLSLARLYHVLFR